MKSEPMEENLVGYLLGALTPGERQQVEAYLRARPDARARLALLEQALAPLADDEDPPPPPRGLAASTLARGAKEQGRRPPWPFRHQLDGRGRHWARRVDWAVAAVLF